MRPRSTRPTVAVMHAGGRTGRRLSRRLLGAGHAVRALGRSAERLQDLRAAGAEVHAADPTDPGQLVPAFEGADIVYALLPYDLMQPGYLARQRRLGEALAAAVRLAGVPRVVFLSSLGAELGEGTGLILSLHDQEQRLADVPWLHAVFLRAGDFMENRLAAVYALRARHRWHDAVSADRPVPMVAASDIADVAFEAVHDASWTGLSVREVLGPHDLSPAEVTDILGRHLGMPDARYECCAPAALRDVLVGAGLPPDVAELTAQLSQGIEEGRIRSRQGRTPQNSTPTAFDTFVSRSLPAPGTA
ncbi:MAG: NAD(P)H-binding protein [Ideonella sp.]|nr:NAD(P)H-binding protein [Ideonella sp.]